jgi:hypothetical protein
MDVKRGLIHRLADLERRRITAEDHVYVCGYEWLDDETIGVLLYGHGQHDRNGFCGCYAVGLSGRIAACEGFTVPPQADPEEYCDKISR